MPDVDQGGATSSAGEFRSLLLLAMLLVPLSAVVSAQRGPAKADYMIVERPDQLRVLNQYQQELSPRERAALPPFTPMRIVRERDFLSDGFTPCETVDIGGSRFYLLTTPDGNLASHGSTGVRKLFRNATPRLDTVVVLASSSLTITPPGAGRSAFVVHGERLARVFSDGAMAYVRRGSGSPVYGWVSLAGAREHRDWEPVLSPRRAETKMSAGVLERVRKEIDEANRLLADLFAYFNKERNEQMAPPQWEVRASGESITCVLTRRSRGEDFSGSTQELAKNLALALLGSDLGVFVAPDTIDIRER